MEKRILIIDEAWIDIDEITGYYQRISTALRQRFEIELFEIFEKLQNDDVSFRRYKHIYRRVNLNTFPFKVFYKELPDTIIVAAIIHALRSNSFLKRKLFK